jgi:carotenoid cleavage dioxygenase-like enzyme
MATRTHAAAGVRRLGFESQYEEVRADALPLDGELPPWLAGTLVRVTPAMLDVGGRPLRHWFDGLAMLNAFTFGDGRVGYGSRFLDTDTYRGAREGRFDRLGFAEDPCRSLFKRVSALFSPDFTDNTNVNLVRLGERYLAMTELPLPVEFDPETLETLGLVRFKDRLGGHHTTPHPQHDAARGEAIFHAARFSARSSYRVYGVDGSLRRRQIASVAAREPAYMHSFGMSERYLVLTEQPLVVNPLSLALSGKPFIDNYRWEPDRGTRFLVIDRNDGRLRGLYEGDPFFCFHHANAFDRDGELVVDVVAFEDPSIIEMLEVEPLREGSEPPPTARLRRCRIDLDRGGVRYESLADASLELPRINYRAVNGRPYRYVYAAGTASDWISQVVKVDVTSGDVRVWEQPGCYPGEPVFVSAPDAREEDDGLVLSVVLDTASKRSFLLVLDAGSFEEVARAEAPHHIPFGFHGQFFG